MDAREYLERLYGIDAADELRRFYDESADDYDRIVVEDAGYVSPRVCAEALAARVPDRSARIADLGCGTGLVGEALADLGFTNVEGLDFAPRMLGLAGAKGCYAALHEVDLNAPLAFADGEFAAAVSAGAFGQHHVGPDALGEALRVVAPGGALCFSVNERAFDALGFRDRVDALVAAGTADLVSSTLEPYHVKAGFRGWVVVLSPR